MFSPDMADFCTSSKPDCPVLEGQSGGGQLVFGHLHGGRHTSHHRGYVDDRHSRSANHGTKMLIFDCILNLLLNLLFPLEGCVRLCSCVDL